MESWVGESSDTLPDLQRLLVAIEINRIEMQKAWERAKNLDAAMETVKATQRNIESRPYAPGKQPDNRAFEEKR